MRTEPSLADDPEPPTLAKRDNRHSVTLDLHSSVAMALSAVLSCAGIGRGRADQITVTPVGAKARPAGPSVRAAHSPARRRAAADAGMISKPTGGARCNRWKARKAMSDRISGQVAEPQ